MTTHQWNRSQPPRRDAGALWKLVSLVGTCIGTLPRATELEKAPGLLRRDRSHRDQSCQPWAAATAALVSLGRQRSERCGTRDRDLPPQVVSMGDTCTEPLVRSVSLVGIDTCISPPVSLPGPYIRIIISWCLMLLSVGVLGSDRVLQFQVGGVVTWNDRTSHFLVEVRGGEYYMRLTPTNWPIRHPEGQTVVNPVAYELASDRNNTYEMKTFSPRDFPPPLNTQVAERWQGSRPDGEAAYYEAYALWYAFASHDYLDVFTNQMLMGLEPLMKDVRSVLETNSVFPFLPRRLVQTNSEATYKCELQVLAFTNAFGLSVPRLVDVDYISLRRGMSWCKTHIAATSFHPTCVRTNFALALSGKQSVVYDATYRNSNPPFVARFNTNDWPSSNYVRSQFDNRVRARALSSPSKGKRSVAIFVLVTVFLVPIPLALMFKSKPILKKPTHQL
jgi:hypothetical protein